MTFREHNCANPTMTSLEEVLSKQPGTPLSPEEDKLATTLVRRKLAQGSEDGMVHFRTGGQV